VRNVVITCDSTCDLTRELYEKYDAHVISMGVTLGDDFRRDGLNVTNQDIFDYVASCGQLPKTSAVSVGEYEEVFSKFVSQGNQVIHINLSSELSASHQNARLAAQMVGDVFVVDSRSLSTGMGHLVMLARELLNADLTAEEVVNALEELKQKLDVSFVLQTLEYLHKGGRCSGVAAFGANVMKLRPEIQVLDGRMDVGRKYRGSMEKSILSYVRGRLEGRTDVDTRRIFVMHSGVPQEILDKVCDLIKELQSFEEIIVGRAGSTITSHCGPDCLGVLFMKKEA